jgi:hypothetical protein
LKLEDIGTGALIDGILPHEPVKIKKVEFIGPDCVSLFFRTANGAVVDQMLFRDDEPHLAVAQQGRPWGFDADGAEFRLGAESHRIRLAHLFDPLMAVHTSNTEPLPHQTDLPESYAVKYQN